MVMACNGVFPAQTEPSENGLFGAADLSQTRLLRRNLRFLISAFTCMTTSGIIFLVAGNGVGWLVATTIAMVGLALGYPLFWAALKTIVLARNKLTTEVFITLALIGVLVVHNYWYASWVVFILWVGETLMAWSGRRARSAVEELLNLVPQQARLIGDGNSTDFVPVEQVKVGDVVAVYPGERIPVDGVVVSGETAVDQSMLTGESVPVDREYGDEVFAGTFNLLGAIQVRTRTVAAENTVAQIVELMRGAQRDRLPVQRTVDLFLRWFLPIVLLSCAGTFVLTGSLERVASILLVITPCAFAASTPLALVATIGNAARRGIVIKNGACIEALTRADVALLDKTGTLTTPTPVLAAVEPLADDKDDLLTLAAVAERQSGHPLARAVVDAALARGLTVPEPTTFQVASGHGVYAAWNGRSIAVGNERFIAREGLVVPLTLRERARRCEDEGHTLSYVAVDGSIRGYLGFLAMPRHNAHEVVTGLRRFGMRHLVMLTGDRSRPAQAIADRLGLEYLAEMAPQAKLEQVQRWKNQGYHVVMVGDGINDASALAAADVGIAMGGSAGAEISASAADMVIHGDRLGSVLAAARIARHGVRAIRLNIFFATFYNIVGLFLGLLNFLSPGTAVMFHAASFLSVVINSALVLRYNPKVQDEPDPAVIDSADAAKVSIAA